MRVRPIVAAVLCLLALPAGLPSARAAEEMHLRLDGAEAEFSASCFIDGGASYVPLAAFARAMGEVEVTWDGRAARVAGDGLALRAEPGQTWLEANGRLFYAPGGIRLEDGRTLAPLTVLARVWPMALRWDGAARTVFAERTEGGPPEPGRTYYDPAALDLLARIISAESRGEPLRGQIAVGTVVLGRMASPEFPDTMEQVVFQAGQFEPVENGTIFLEPCQLSVVAAKLCLDGAREAEGSLYFFAPALSPGTWIRENRSFVTAIGRHDFYR